MFGGVAGISEIFSFTKNLESDFLIKNPNLTKKSGGWEGEGCGKGK